MYQKGMKRIIGLLMAVVITVCISPVLLVIAVAIKCESRGPVLFRQKRVGIHRELFEIYKFRSMRRHIFCRTRKVISQKSGNF